MTSTIVLSETIAEAQPAHKQKRAQPATPSSTALDITGTVSISGSRAAAQKTPASVLAAIPDPAAPDEGPLSPDFNLPTASRARMRACGERWKQAKLNGEIGDEIWRDFATACLSAKADPVPPKATVGESARPAKTEARPPSAAAGAPRH